jgi:hypothetical protein
MGKKKDKPEAAADGAAGEAVQQRKKKEPKQAPLDIGVTVAPAADGEVPFIAPTSVAKPAKPAKKAKPTANKLPEKAPEVPASPEVPAPETLPAAKPTQPVPSVQSARPALNDVTDARDGTNGDDRIYPVPMAMQK